MRKQLYFTFAPSYLIYGIECWGNTSKENLNKIIILQKRLIKIIYSLHPPTHCAPYDADAKILFADDLYHYQLCVHAFKVYNKLPIPDCNACLFYKSNYCLHTRGAKH